MGPPSDIHPDLNEAVAVLDYNGTANIMEYDVNEDAPPAKAVIVPVVGGIYVLMDNTRRMVIHKIHEPFEEFKKKQQGSEK